MTARSTVSFDDFYDGLQYHGIYNMTQVQPAQVFGNLLNRMVYTGQYFGTEKDAVKALILFEFKRWVLP